MFTALTALDLQLNPSVRAEILSDPYRGFRVREMNDYMRICLVTNSARKGNYREIALDHKICRQLSEASVNYPLPLSKGEAFVIKLTPNLCRAQETAVYNYIVFLN